MAVDETPPANSPVDAQVVRCSSSLRSRSVQESLRQAKLIARELGIVRVTDTTRLDRFGVPVFASIRPDATRGSLCVSAGKGITTDEAKIGAFMEATELAWAEPDRARLPIVPAVPDHLAADLMSFCPRRGIPLDDRAIDCVVAHDVDSGEEVLVPAELVVFPRPARYYTSDTNGLASGNSLIEATVHGLAELIERDLTSFQTVWDTSRVVRNSTLPEPLASIARRAEDQGCTLTVRAYENELRLPYFHVVLREIGGHNAVHPGYGCHPWRAIAVTRAIVEAFQSRLGFIHGGRDSLARMTARLGSQRSEILHKLAAANEHDPDPLDFHTLVDRAAETPTVEACYRLLSSEARRVGRVLRVIYTPDGYPFQVVRILVPGLEFFHHDTNRMGRRLGRHLLARRAAV
jgi:ribosomal protein S12 methylthiotransferase accessory factor